MKSIYRGTTPLLKFDYPYKYEEIVNMSISFAQDGNTLLTLSMGDDEIHNIADYEVSVELTQEQTNLFKHNFPMETQIKLKNTDGQVWVSDIEHYQIHRILDEDVM